MYLEAGFRGRPWLAGRSGSVEKDWLTQASPTLGHWPILQYYQVPTVSYAEVPSASPLLGVGRCHVAGATATAETCGSL